MAYSGPFTGGYTNTHATTAIIVNNVAFTGNLVNTSTISPAGITVTNSTIHGDIKDSGDIAGGISLDSKSLLTGASDYGIAVTGPTLLGGVANSGTISGTNTGIYANTVTTFQGGVRNNGTVAAGVNGINVNGSATFGGGIINSSGGVISAAIGFGIGVAEFAAFGASSADGITNLGMITAAGGAGVLIDNITAFSANISNSGSISASTGLGILGSTIAGAIIDSGTISGSSHGILIDSGSKIIAVTTAIEITATSFTGGIANAGTIVLTPAEALDYGIYLLNVSAFSGGITNSGTISASAFNGPYGIFLDNVSEFSSGITNSGTISAAGDGAGIAFASRNLVSTFSGGVTNSGTILGAQADGVLIENNLTFENGILNSGTILVGEEGIEVYDPFNTASFAGGITNIGSISANRGVEIEAVSDFSGGVTNAGTVSASVAQGIYVADDSTFAAAISNNGTITAKKSDGIGVSDVSVFGSAGAGGGISNNGTISAPTGILVSQVSTFLGGITNTGNIIGTSAAINVAGNITIVQDAGIISGAVELSTGNILDVAGGAIDGNITGGATIDFAPMSGDPFTYSGNFVAGQVNFNSGVVVLTGANHWTALNIAGGAALELLGGVPLSQSGDVMTSTTLASGGALEIGSGAVLSGFHFSGGGIVDIASGGQAFNTVVSPGGTMLVGGVVSGTIVSGGEEYIGIFGTATQTQIEAAGIEVVFGTVDNVAIGGIQYDFAFANVATVLSGGLQYLESGAVESAAFVSSGGEQYIASGAIASTTQIEIGGAEVVVGTDRGGAAILGVQYDFGAAYGGTAYVGGFQWVQPGGTAIGLEVLSTGEQYVGSGGTASASNIAKGGIEAVFGTDIGAAVSGTQYVFGLESGATVSSGGVQAVESGGTTSGVVVLGGGEQFVGSSGISLDVQIAAFAAEVVFGTDSGAAVSGTQYVFDATASGGTTYDGGYQLVGGGNATGMTVEGGGVQYIGEGGTAFDTQIEQGGAEVIFGADSGAAVSGTQYVNGTAQGGTTYNSGFQLVGAGGTAVGMTILSGGVQYIGSNGTSLAADVASAGAEVIFGAASGALVSGTQYVFGVASGGTTFGGGSQQVEPGGTAVSMTVSSGSQQYVGAGGTAIGTDIVGDGAEVVRGTDLGATISGTQYVYGLASGTVVATGGYQLVSAGGTVSAANISGGTLEFTSGASNGTAPITFTGAGELILDASTSFSGTVAGFDAASSNNSIDFADIPFVASGSTATAVNWIHSGNSSGTLMVVEGSHSADLTLLGQYGGNFAATNDGHGGTLVTYTPAAETTDTNPLVLAGIPRG